MTAPARIETATVAGIVDLANIDCDPATTLITPRAIAHGLARINRFAGATELPVNLADHSIRVANIVGRRHPRLQRGRLHALLHDAHEYLLGDIKTPTQRLLEQEVPGTGKAIDRLKTRIDLQIFHALAIQPPDGETAEAVAEADWMAAHIEWQAHIPAANGESPWARQAEGLNLSRLLDLATTQPWAKAEELYLHALCSQLDRWSSNPKWRG